VDWGIWCEDKIAWERWQAELANAGGTVILVWTIFLLRQNLWVRSTGTYAGLGKSQKGGWGEGECLMSNFRMTKEAPNPKFQAPRKFQGSNSNWAGGLFLGSVGMNGQYFVSPAPHAHYVEPLALEDDLLYRLLAIVAFSLEPVAHFHPVDFAFGIPDQQ
jgi:hypothetical protein